MQKSQIRLGEFIGAIVREYYSPDQDRDEDGQFAPEGSSSSGSGGENESVGKSLSKNDGQARAFLDKFVSGDKYWGKKQALKQRDAGGFNLTDSEATLLFSYTDKTYHPMNQQLRFGKLTQSAIGDQKVMNKNIRGIEATMNSALDKLPTYNGVVSRRSFVTHETMEKYKPGKIITEKGFVSSKAQARTKFKPVQGGHPDAILGVEYIITSKTGRRISAMSRRPGEKEILFKSRTKFKVLEVDKDPLSRRAPIIKMAEV